MDSPQFTDEQLHDAWERRRREDWPDDFDAVMADPILSRLVRTAAAHGTRTVRRLEVVRPAEPLPPVAKPVPVASSLRVPKQEAFFDRKRAAAGDRDDD